MTEMKSCINQILNTYRRQIISSRAYFSRTENINILESLKLYYLLMKCQVYFTPSTIAKKMPATFSLQIFF